MSINRVNISGNLTRDPELRSTNTGTQVLTFGVAVNDRRRNPQSGEWEDVPNFVDCVVFGNRAQSLANFLSKGSKVAIEGKLRYSSWESNGQRRSKLEVVVDEVEFLSSRSQSGGYQQMSQGSQQRQGGYDQGSGYQTPQSYDQGGYSASVPQPASNTPVPPIQQTPPSNDVYDEDIPF